MTDELDPRNLFYRDSHGHAVARNNQPFKKPAEQQHEDVVVLREARAYVAENQLDHGHLVVEHGSDGQYCWIAKVRGTTRWKSRGFSLASGQYSLGDTEPFKQP